jgi:hypothetical protein
VRGFGARHRRARRDRGPRHVHRGARGRRAPLLTRRKRGPRFTQAPASTPATLANLSNAQLAREWHSSYTALAAARDPRSLERICALRRCQLDEIERRTPGGLQRWVESGNGVRGDSAPFLGG